VHVGIADQHRKGEAAHNLVRPRISRFGPKHDGDIAIAAVGVFVVGKQPEDLRKILHVDALPAGALVEAPDRERLPSKRSASSGRPRISLTSIKRLSGTVIPTDRASSSMTNSFSGTPENGQKAT
jgi:hypothetical protein